jgi:hypothetical protein
MEVMPSERHVRRKRGDFFLIDRTGEPDTRAASRP